MTEFLRCALLLLNALIITSQLSSWKMNYGFAMGVQMDMCFSFVLLVLLLLRGLWGPISLPYLRIAIVHGIYIVSSGAIAGLAIVRVVYCLYMRHLLLNHWPREDDIQTVRYDYYVMESVTWTLQAALNVSTVFDLWRIRTHVD